MGAFGNYFLDGPNLASAIAVYTDSTLSTAAPDGFYSQNGIVRQQLNGILVTSVPCPSCEEACDTQIVSAATRGGAYFTSTFALGESTGVVRIAFQPNSCAKGFRFNANGVGYNEVSTQNYGYKVPSTNNLAYNVLGDFNNAACGNPTPGSYSLDIFKLEGGLYQQQPGSESVIYASGDDNTTFAPPGICVGYYRKQIAGPMPLEVEIASQTAADGFSLLVECPTLLLPTFYGADCGEECPEDDTIYNIPVNGSPGVIGLYDWVFEDNMAQNGMPQGQYYICNIDSVITVDANSVVTNIVSCS